MPRRTFVAGNWKMHKTTAESVALAREVRQLLAQVRDRVQIAVAPPFTSVHAVAQALEGSNIEVSGQHCHFEVQGAYTGEVAAQMLKEAGCRHVIVGHSERRQYFHETDELVNKRVHAAVKAGLRPIVCVGETLQEREGGKTLEVVSRQVKGALAGVAAEIGRGLTLAYEPVWAIGTGKTATARQAQDVHAHIRGLLRELWGAVADEIRIQYGGSVKPDNAAELLSQPDIDGALVGGASLKAQDFAAIVKAKG